MTCLTFLRPLNLKQINLLALGRKSADICGSVGMGRFQLSHRYSQTDPVNQNRVGVYCEHVFEVQQNIADDC